MDSEFARELRGEFLRSNVFVVSLVSSPGSGKTTLLKKVLTCYGPITAAPKSKSFFASVTVVLAVE